MTFVGVMFLVLGVLALLAPIASTFVATIVIGIMLIAGGVLRFFHAFEDRRRHSIGWLILTSIFYVGAGLAVLWRPLIGSLSLMVVIGTLFIVGAISKLIHAYQFRGTRPSGWLVFDAIISAGLGILLLAGLPSTAFWALGVIVGVDLIIAGITWLAIGNPRTSTPAL